MTKASIDEKRLAWLKAAKSICLLAFERRGKYEELYPCRQPDKKEKATALREIAALNKRISNEVRRLAAIEAEASGSLGIRALVGQKVVPEPVHVALALLVTACFSDAVANEIRQVSGLVELAAGQDCQATLDVREAFRSDGVLRPHVVLDERGAPALDRCSVLMPEKVVNLCLGLPADEQEAVLARGTSAGWRVR